MLKTRTVLVLGAGASAPFGFPIASKLSDLVSDVREGHSGPWDLLLQAGFSSGEINSLRDSFYYSGKHSLDAFLEHRSDLMTIGKVITAALLFPFENTEKLFSANNNWLRQLYNAMNSQFEDFGNNPLSIVTFNYDRTVEHFFFTALKHSYGKSDDATKEAVSRIPIVHLHGSLGPLPWQNKKGIEFGCALTSNSLSYAASTIKVIHEEVTGERDEEFKRARELIEKAQRVYFLGFGYNSTNLSRLGITDASTNLYGTCHGMSSVDKSRVKAITRSAIRFLDGDCFQVVRDKIA